MAEADDIIRVSQDQGVKELLIRFAVDAVAFFMPDTVAQRGLPVSVVPLFQELPFAVLGDASLAVDVPLLATWTDGHEAIIVLVEHYSEARKVDHPKLLFYLIGLKVRHRQAGVFPVVLVTDRSTKAVQDHWTMTVNALEVCALRIHVVRVTSDDQEHLLTLKNKIAAMLVALTVPGPAAEAGLAGIRAMRDAGYTPDDFRYFLSLLMNFARMGSEDVPRFKQLLKETPDMSTFLDEMINESKAEGQLAVILSMVAKGAPATLARQQIEELVADGSITRAQADVALAKLD